jgi:NADH-quinone oxidoreductase subunit G
MAANGEAPVMVNLTIDGKKVSVPKGTNVIEAAKSVGIEIPFYCYHPHLSIAGNCRMCQIQVKGQPKLAIGCNTAVAEGMEVLTQNTSKDVEDAQAGTLEFILINHPLDCTVCDQAGHCKLQDYHFDYNARPSRFLEDKEHKVKAEPLGPHVILDGERCIMCTRCIRFCDEITKTSELGMLNRGDKSVIAINPGRELNNPLSGTVVDLCPVGALTHRDWRFNTRIWFTKQTDSICPGCSTGCSTKVAIRDGQVVQVKARMNDAVNKEWLCDEGRYGYHRFLPQQRVTEALVRGKITTTDAALKETAKFKGSELLVFVSPDLLLEEYALLKQYLSKVAKSATVAIAYRERKLSDVEKIIVSPDYAANFRGAEFSGLVSGNLEAGYNEALEKLRSGGVQNVLVVGDRGILPADADERVATALQRCGLSVALLCDRASRVASASHVVLPARSILEKAGLLVNRNLRLQYSDRVMEIIDGTEPEWRLIAKLAQASGVTLTDAQDDRASTVSLLGGEPRLAGLKISTIKAGGVCLKSYQPGTGAASAAAQSEMRSSV